MAKSPTDIFGEAEGLKRRRALLEALQAQNLNAPVQGKYGIGAALGKLAGAYFGAQQGKALDTEQAGLNARYNQELSAGIDKYLKGMTGAPGQTLSEGQADALMNRNVDPGPLAEPVAPDPQRAIVEAMGSRFPELQAVGGAGLKEHLAEIRARKKGPEFKDHIVDGRVVRVYSDGRTEAVGDFKDRDKWEDAPPIVKADGSVVQMQRNVKTGELKPKAGSGQSISINNTPENKGRQRLLENTVEQVSPKGKSYEAAQAADSNIRLTTESLAALKQGADMGFAADLGLQLRKLGERAGIPSAATAPTDQLSSLLKERVFSKLGGLGVAISDADRKFMQEAAGDISKDPRAMKRLLALDFAASLKEVQKHNARVEQLADNEGFELARTNRFPVNVQVDDPEFSAMVDNVLAGRPTVSGVAAPARPASAPSGEPTSRWGEPVKIQGFGK